MTTATRYELIDSRTGAVIGTYRSRTRAYARADRMDAEYGAVRYVVRPVWG